MRPEDKLPWNTGKVQIGLHYVPPVRKYELSRDAEQLQSLLLGKNKSTIRIGFVLAYIVMLAMVAVFLSIWP
jgi:hypothetical protein